jgi:uncharacterized cupin superfamily protein
MTTTAHWDDARSARFDVGPMGADWDFLGGAAGCDQIGLRRIRISPGKQSTPVHAHFGEEELFYVLHGSGVSWQESGVHAIGEGDAVLHPHGGPAHTVVAGDDGIDVLAFGDNLRHEAVRFPRINASWIGGMILEFLPTHQFQLEADRAGPVEVPAELDPRPKTIVHVPDMPAIDVDRPPTRGRLRSIGRTLGARRTALNWVELLPGGESAPPHSHSAEEELFIVMEGEGVLMLVGPEGTEDEHPVRRGSLVSRRPGTGIAHGFRAGEQGLTLLMYSDKPPGDACFYPRSGKVALRGLGVIFKPEPVGYWDD